MLTLYAGLPGLLVGPPTFLLGYSLPFLQRAVQNDARWLGRRVGWLQTANITGSLLGSLVTGFALLPLLGTAATFRVIAVAALAFAGLAAVAGARRLALVLAASAALAAVVVPDRVALWARLHAADPAQMLEVEDASGVSVLRSGEQGEGYAVMAGGLGVSTLPFGGFGGTHTLLGALPVLLHPSPKSVAVIGLGSGDTAFAAAGRPETESVEVVEIIGSQLELLRDFDALGRDPGLRALLGDARIHIHIDDGRAFLRRDQRRYDVIEADALRPTSAYSGNLYSREYFALLRERLAPGGYAVTWAPTERVLATVVASFRFAARGGDIVIGCPGPIAIDRAAILARASDPTVRAYYAQAGIDIDGLLRPYLRFADVVEYGGPHGAQLPDDDLNSDLFAKDEFLVPRLR
jgi:predicted membrane-bound spermidine synthase